VEDWKSIFWLKLEALALFDSSIGMLSVESLYNNDLLICLTVEKLVRMLPTSFSSLNNDFWTRLLGALLYR